MDIQKLDADIKRCLKHYRAEHLTYGGQKASEEVANLFQRANSGLGSLGEGLAGLWLNNFIKNSTDENEPSSKNVDILIGLQSFINGDPCKYLDSLSNDDWEEIKDIVDCEAEDLPLDDLQNMMSIILDHCEF